MVKRMKNLFSNIKGEFTMKFTKTSQIVKSWVDRIKQGVKTFEDVPFLYNLRKVVKSILDEDSEKEK